MLIIVSISKTKCQTVAEIHTCRGLVDHALAAWYLLRVLNSTWPCNILRLIFNNRNKDYESQQQYKSCATLDFVYLILLVGEYDSRKGMGFDRSGCLHSESVLIHFPSWSQAQPAAPAPFPIFRGSTSSSRDQSSLNDLDICKLADADDTLIGAKLPMSRLPQFGSFSPPLSHRFAMHGGPCKIPPPTEKIRDKKESLGICLRQ